MMKFTAALLAAAAALGLATAAPARAIELKVADSLPPGHYLARLMLKPWMEDVKKRTNGAVTFNYFPNQQLGKARDMLRLAQSGIVDIAYIGPSYVSDKMPLSEVAELPGEFTTSCEGTQAYWKLAHTGILAKDEYAPNKIRLMMVVMLPPYHIFTVKQKIEAAKDVDGLKLRTTGGAQDLTLRALGAAPVRMAAPDAYEALSRGTLDGLLFPTESVISYSMDKLVKHATQGVGFASFVFAYSISEASWNRLSPDVQKAMEAASDDIERTACAGVDAGEKASQTKLEKSGVEFDPLPAATVADFKTKLKGVAAEWARSLDKRGKPGSEVLKEFEAALAEPSK